MNRKLLLLPLAGMLLLAQSSSDTAWGLLDTAAANKSAGTRATAAKALGLIKGNARAQSNAEKLLSDSDPGVRSAAAGSLGQTGARSAIPKLKAAALKEQESGVVFAIANALYEFNDPTAYGFYYAALTGEKKSGEGLLDSQLKMLKDPKALAQVGFEQGIGFIPYVGYAQAAYKMLKKDDSTPVRAAAAQKLARDPDPRSGQALVQALSDSKPLLRVAAADAIAKRGDRALADSLVPLFKDSDELTRLNGSRGLPAPD